MHGRLRGDGPECQQRRTFTFRDSDVIGSKVEQPGQMGTVLEICIKSKPIFIRIIFFLSEGRSKVLTLTRGRVYGNQAREV